MNFYSAFFLLSILFSKIRWMGRGILKNKLFWENFLENFFEYTFFMLFSWFWGNIVTFYAFLADFNNRRLIVGYCSRLRFGAVVYPTWNSRLRFGYAVMRLTAHALVLSAICIYKSLSKSHVINFSKFFLHSTPFEKM